MTAIAILSLILNIIVLWGAYSRIYEHDERLFELEAPKLKDTDGIIASYLGKADE
jgi:hypothetical protein